MNMLLKRPDAVIRDDELYIVRFHHFGNSELEG